MLHIIAVITNPVQFTPGQPNVMIPFSIVSPANLAALPLQHTNTTQDVLSAKAGSDAWGDEPCRAVVLDHLTAAYGADGFDFEVLLAPEWAKRQDDAAAAAAEAEAAAAKL